MHNELKLIIVQTML